MGRRYYCDYCDKTFIDDLDARKKHLISSHHIKLRKLHYEQHRDPRTILAEESVKMSCRRFLQHGECQFAGSCKYTHYSTEDLWHIKQQIALEDYDASCQKQVVPEVPSLESWLEKYNIQHSKLTKRETDDVSIFWTYPERLEYRVDLPPSLKKFKPEDFKDSDFAEWGIVQRIAGDTPSIQTFNQQGGKLLVDAPRLFTKQKIQESGQTTFKGAFDIDALDIRDIDKEFRIRGYTYTNAFKSTQEVCVDGSMSFIQWRNNWVAYMDNMLQGILVNMHTRHLYVSVSIDCIQIDPEAHANYINRIGKDRVPSYCNRESLQIGSGYIYGIFGQKKND
ncbi:hypothetical protein FQA39_LY11484 [Lamprigera yunnana]|nr:hypothetical protein FQA39_LY11484 [Lamprigera yunnana]